MDYFYLNELDDEKLEEILKLNEADFLEYVDFLIQNYYPKVEKHSEMYYQLAACYHSSFMLEQIYRELEPLQIGFTAIYTKTGLFRELVNDVYEIPPYKTAVH